MIPIIFPIFNMPWAPKTHHSHTFYLTPITIGSALLPYFLLAPTSPNKRKKEDQAKRPLPPGPSNGSYAKKLSFFGSYFSMGRAFNWSLHLQSFLFHFSMEEQSQEVMTKGSFLYPFLYLIYLCFYYLSFIQILIFTSEGDPLGQPQVVLFSGLWDWKLVNQ